MGTTAGGLPYPEPTDPIAQGADAIKNLATKTEARYLSGFANVTSAANGVCTVTFPAAFPSAPNVIAVLQFSTGGTDFTGYVITSTTTGFTYRLFQAGALVGAGVAARINYLAIGVPA